MVLIEGALIALISGAAFVGTLIAHGTIFAFSSKEKIQDKISGQIVQSVKIQKSGISIADCIVIALPILVSTAIIIIIIVKFCNGLRRQPTPAPRNNRQSESVQFVQFVP